MYDITHQKNATLFSHKKFFFWHEALIYDVLYIFVQKLLKIQIKYITVTTVTMWVSEWKTNRFKHKTYDEGLTFFLHSGNVLDILHVVKAMTHAWLGHPRGRGQSKMWLIKQIFTLRWFTPRPWTILYVTRETNLYFTMAHTEAVDNLKFDS